MSRPGKLIKEWTINRVELESNKDEAKAEEQGTSGKLTAICSSCTVLI